MRYIVGMATLSCRVRLRRFLWPALVLPALVGLPFIVMPVPRLAKGGVPHLNDGRGPLVVADRGRFYVREIATHEKLTWRWQIYVPQGDIHRSISGGGIPESGTRTTGGGASSNARPGEQTITARVERDDSGKWGLTLAGSNWKLGISIRPEQAGWLAEGRAFQAEVAGRKSTESFAAHDGMVLLRLRAPTAQQAANRQPSDGVMIWFAPNQVPVRNRAVPRGRRRALRADGDRWTLISPAGSSRTRLPEGHLATIAACCAS